MAWFAIEDIPALVYDHNEILDYGLAHIRKEMRHRPIGFELLPEKFTILELQSLYETLFNTTLDKGNFRRKILKSGLLEECQEKQMGVRHRAAKFYQFVPTRYEELVNTGFSFVL